MSDQEVNGQADGHTQSGNAPDEQPIMSPGARLAAYRKEHGWTVEQVASQLNLAPRQIVAIESDDYSALPGMPIVRGFIRAYAKLLKVDPAPLLAMLGGETVFAPEAVASRKSLSAPFSDARLPSMAERPGLSSKWIVGLLLALLAGVAIWASRLGGDIAEISRSATSQVQDGLANMSGAEKNEAAGAESEAPTEVLPAPTTGMADNTASGTAVAPVAPAATPVPPPPPAAAPAAAAPAESTVPASGNMLVLNVREESWIEVRRADGKGVLLSRIVKAGETESIEVTEPVSVVIGNAAGVDATLRGTPIELKTASKSNVARLNLK